MELLKREFAKGIAFFLAFFLCFSLASVSSAYRDKAYKEGYRAGYFGYLEEKKKDPTLTERKYLDKVWSDQLKLKKPHHYYKAFKDGVRDAIRQRIRKSWLSPSSGEKGAK